MTDADLRIEDDPRPEDRNLLNERLYEFNAQTTGIHDGRWLAIFVRGDDGEIAAGLSGWTWGGTAHVDTFWIREDLRRHGLGKRLLDAAEAEATRRGCTVLQLSTHSYQAPGFYRRQGYEEVGALPGWPAGTTRYFFSKTLT
jgi:ribosomal protein S18 acetylase RimI-like enzyme